MKRLPFFWAFLFIGGFCVFLPICVTLSEVALCLSQCLCTYVPSHPPGQVGASTTDLKVEHCRGAQRCPIGQGTAVPAAMSQKCEGSFETIGDFQHRTDHL